MKKNFFIPLIYFILQPLYAMLPDNRGLIEINGNRCTMLAHINQAHQQPLNHFRFAQIIRFNPIEKQFITINEAGRLDDEETINDIWGNNYVFVPTYKEFWVGDSLLMLSAVIVGTRDKRIANLLKMFTHNQ